MASSADGVDAASASLVVRRGERHAWTARDIRGGGTEAGASMGLMSVGELAASAGGETAVVQWGVVAALLLLLAVLLVFQRRSRRPRVGEVWFAQVPFRDGPGSKDRPVLVLESAGRHYLVAPFTSRDKSGRRDYVRVPAGIPGLTRVSWVSTEPMRLRRRVMRRRSGSPGIALVDWYVSTGSPGGSRAAGTSVRRERR